MQGLGLLLILSLAVQDQKLLPVVGAWSAGACKENALECAVVASALPPPNPTCCKLPFKPEFVWQAPSFSHRLHFCVVPFVSGDTFQNIFALKC